MVGELEGCDGFHDGQQEAAIQVCGLGERTKKLVETSAEASECWGVEAGATSTIQPIVGIGREV